MKPFPPVPLLLVLAIAANASTAEVVVRPPFSEFSITFPAKPDQKTVHALRGDGTYGEGLSYELQIDDTLLRAEFVEVSDPQHLARRSDAELSRVMLDVYNQSGIENGGVDVEHHTGYRAVNGRGSKLILIDGKRTPVTYMNRSYYGSRSMLHITIGSPANVFPTAPVFPFLDSMSFLPSR